MTEALALQRSVTPHSTRFLFFASRGALSAPAFATSVDDGDGDKSAATPRISNTSAMG
eukprot:CAMPEP_0181067728 /NCGR_PEP_ID=MMETSP1070-20121207/26035_1 /TAXON_ID=265543 /ORGANISM="Minutocellus polymorphus, Strain NH13" /LENGTH=57 /DNA_ID=CAMNT_0023148421 /DNA_START=665 /DNA_END=838 /DNA_ORIENTATION=-